MTSKCNVRKAVRLALFASAVPALLYVAPALAQDQAEQGDMTTVVVTGTRVRIPGVVSSSPIYSVNADEIAFEQQPEVEKILRLLPITAAGDGSNANNGSAGAATVNLRGLGEQRNLIMIDGHRVTPYNFNGLVDTSVIPTALIERVDIVTGGASAVYGSDAISGALNFILKRDFQGVQLDSNFSRTGENDGDTNNVSLTLGTNVADGRGNVVLGINWTERKGVLLGQRGLGQLGIVTEDGSGLAEFLAGQGPEPAPAGCGGPNSVAAGGSTTTLPTRVAIAGGPGVGQFRDDGTIGTNCSVFNFNPWNYYQTPQTRYGGTVMGRFDVNNHVEAYSRFSFSSTTVRQQIAPSGVFGDTFWTPLSNPLISAAAQGSFITAGEAGRAAGTVNTAGVFPNWRDTNTNGVVDAPDYLLISYRRRTVEFGPRSTTYDNKAFQFITGARGAVVGDWTYDLSFQFGQSTRTNTNAGYSNVGNIGNALDSLDGVTCVNGDPTCVPLNLFGGYGSITPDQVRYSSATALENQTYSQRIASGSVSGPIDAIKIPWSASPLGVSFGVEWRKEDGDTVPDECLKLAPASCLGGAGGNTLPIAGGFDVNEVFGEAILPIVTDHPGFESLSLELGYRYSDYNPSGANRTYKYGLNWKPMGQLLIRGMKQRAARAPNVGELAAPQVTSLDNASFDPCSVGNPNAIDATLRQRCIDTGMLDAQVGTVEDIVSGQINTFSGTDLTNLPKPELADTTTIGIVWTPEFGALKNPFLSIDYYKINIDGYIDTFKAQEVLDGCYVAGQMDQCDKIERVGGTLTLPGSGLQTFTTNLSFIKAEGVEIGFNFGVDLGNYGSLSFSGDINKYLTQESQSSVTTPLLDCLGRYGTSCGGPLPKIRWVQRTTWKKGDFTASALWRHQGAVSVETVQDATTFPQFQHIGAFDYIDLYGSYQLWNKVRVSLGVSNILDKDPPVVGNEAADTRSNSGNTFPSAYDTIGRVISVGLQATF